MGAILWRQEEWFRPFIIPLLECHNNCCIRIKTPESEKLNLEQPDNLEWHMQQYHKYKSKSIFNILSS